MGVTVACIDHPVVREMLDELGREKRRRTLTYGVAPDADLRLSGIVQEGAKTRFSVEVSARSSGGARMLNDLVIPIPGQYNVLNALAAAGVAMEVGIADDVIAQGLASFGGVKRRFTPTGVWNGVSFYDDYAHHPVEIAATLAAARRSSEGRVIAIMQPHRFSRLSDLFDEFASCFGDADAVLIAPVYAAGEDPIEGVDHRALTNAVREAGNADAIAIDDEAELAPILLRYARPGDLVIGLGAGTVTEWSHALPHQMEEAANAAEARAAGGAA